MCKKVESFQNKRCVVVRIGMAGRGDAGLRPGDAGLRPGDAGLRPGDAGLRPGDAGLRPGDAGLRPGDAGLRPGGAGLRPGDAILRPGDAGLRPGDAGLRPGGAGLRPLFAHTTLKPTGKTKGNKNSGKRPTKKERKKFPKPCKGLFDCFVMWSHYGKK